MFLGTKFLPNAFELELELELEPTLRANAEGSRASAMKGATNSMVSNDVDEIVAMVLDKPASLSALSIERRFGLLTCGVGETKTGPRQMRSAVFGGLA